MPFRTRTATGTRGAITFLYALPGLAVLVGCASSDPPVTNYRSVPREDLRTVASSPSLQVTPATRALLAPAESEQLAGFFDGPAVWLGTEEERALYDALESDEARRQFVESFWQRRDPDTTDTGNEYQEDVERRVETANTAFANPDGPGWSTAFGIALTTFGFPARTTLPAPGEEAGAGSRVVWHFGPADLITNQMAVQFAFRRGAWHMYCSGSIFGLMLAGADPYIPGVPGNGRRSDLSGEGAPTSPDVQGSGYDGNRIAMGSGFGFRGGGAAPPIIDQYCRTAMRRAVYQNLHNPVSYAPVAIAR